jgi:signal transduction histidine kinase
VDKDGSGGRQPAQDGDTAVRWTFGLSGEALGNLAHELRTPVQVLIGFLDILRDDLSAELGPRARELIDRMHSNAHDLAQTLDNLMEFLLSEARVQPTIDENISIGSLIGDVQPSMEAASAKKNLALRFDLSEAPAAIRAPRRALRSIILNLALNAIKFTESGNVTVAIRDAAMPGKSGAIDIEVRDTGPGLKPAMLEQARKPFVQLSRSNARTHRGLGLGLTLVHRNVAALGGSLELKPKDGSGAIFQVRIPVRAVRQTGRRNTIPPLLPSIPRKPPPGARD